MTLNASYDALGRQTSAGQVLGTMAYQYDAAGNRTKVTWPDGYFAQYDYDTIGNVTAIRENGAASGVGVLASYSYDSLGRRIGIVRGNGDNAGIGYNPVSRLQSIGHDFPGAADDVGWGFGYNPASQISQSARDNDAYAWTGHFKMDRTVTSNGLNQFTTQVTAQPDSANPTTTTNLGLGHDPRGNLITAITTVNGGSPSTTTYPYSKLNELTGMSGPSSATLTYDPVGRLAALATSTGTTRFLYDGGVIAG